MKLCQEGSYEEGEPDALFSDNREREKERERKTEERKVKAESTWKDHEARMSGSSIAL